MRGLDPGKAREHRLQQADAGFPLLRGAPCTAAIGLVNFLDGLTGDQRRSFAEQLSDLFDAQLLAPMTAEARNELLRRLPLVERHFGRYMGQPRTPASAIDLRLVPVKVLAAMLKEDPTGGIDGVATRIRLSEEQAARMPPAAHVASLEEIVPVAPRRLKSLVKKVMAARFGTTMTQVASDHSQFNAQLPNGTLKVDFQFSGAGRLLQQFSYHVGAHISARPPLWMASYEGVWLSSANWDYITEANAERSITHLLHQIEACLDLA